MKIIKKEGLSWRKIGDQVLILDARGKHMSHSLNLSAALIWENCDGKNSKEDLANILCKEFEIDLESALNDVQKLIDNLNDMQLLEIS